MGPTTSSLLALSPLDGRYKSKTDELALIFSEFGLMHARTEVEIKWVQFLSEVPQIDSVPRLSPHAQEKLNAIIANFNLDDAQAIKEHESVTNHDVKAVEYFLRDQFNQHHELKPLCHAIHFSLTSEDVNNLAYGLMINKARHTSLNPLMASVISKLHQEGTKYADIPMLARTHGQSASPTTLGKELINFQQRLQTQYNTWNQIKIKGKLNGATGNYHAQCIAYPNLDWPALSLQFVESLGLSHQAFSTQIEPHDHIAELLHSLMRFNQVSLDLCCDIWAYISRGYFTQIRKNTEVGSSTMPHKINPIDFENAEGNLGLCQALCQHMATTLCVSRWQRDLSDSTVLRNLGSCFGYAILAFKSILKGLEKLQANEHEMDADLQQNWEVLTEAIQTCLRAEGFENAYEDLKKFSRGEKITQEALALFIKQSSLSEDNKNKLLKLTPQAYTGLAAQLTKESPLHIQEGKSPWVLPVE